MASRPTQCHRVGIVPTFEDACFLLSVDPDVRAKRNPCGFHYLRAKGHRRGTGRVQFYNAERTAGVVLNWSTGEYCLFFPERDRKPTEAEIAEAERKRELWQRITDEETAKRHAKTAIRARTLLEASGPADGNPYLLRKQVQAVGTLRQATGRQIYEAGFYVSWHPFRDEEELLLAPMSHGGEVVNIQIIPERGQKLVLPDGKAGGCLWLSETLPETSEDKLNIGLAEGVATILSVVESFAEHGVRMTGACSFGCSNLPASAVRLHERFPRATIFVFGDLGNGSESARDASEALCGDRDRLVRFPSFTEEERALYRSLNGGKEPTDFNDKRMLTKALKAKK